MAVFAKRESHPVPEEAETRWNVLWQFFATGQPPRSPCLHFSPTGIELHTPALAIKTG